MVVHKSFFINNLKHTTMTEAEKQINLNAGFKLSGGAPHTIVETGREALSEVPEKTDEEVYAQPAEEEEEGSDSKED